MMLSAVIKSPVSVVICCHLVLVLCLSCIPVSLWAADSSDPRKAKFALLLGNQNYDKNALSNPVYDVELVGEKLRELDFDVTIARNLSQSQLRVTVREFAKKSQNSYLRLFYYAGHGMSTARDEYIIPVDFDFEEFADPDTDPAVLLPDTSTSLNSVLTLLEKWKVGSNVLVFDACRDLVLPGTRSLKRVASLGGSGSLKAENDTVFFYSTSVDTPAFDGLHGEGSMFAQAFAKNLKREPLTFRHLNNAVTRTVVRESKKRQKPWTRSSTQQDLYLWGSATAHVPLSTGDDPQSLLAIADSNQLRRNYCKQSKELESDKKVHFALNLFNGTEGEAVDKRAAWSLLAEASEGCSQLALLEMGKLAERLGKLDQARGMVEFAIEQGVRADRLLKRINRKIKRRK